jgi:hypothetical protein
VKNDQHRDKILSKLTYSRDFKPPFKGGLRNPKTQKESYKPKLNFKALYHKVHEMNYLSKNHTIKDVFKEYANKKSIKDITEEMMDALEKDIANIDFE